MHASSPSPPRDIVFEAVDVLPGDLEPLRSAAEAEGYRFVTRLEDEWHSGAMRFDREGEIFVVARRAGRLVGFIGLCADPYLRDPRVGRVRHLYVAPGERRKGFGARLLDRVVDSASQSFQRLRLRTTTEDAAHFYESRGFVPCDEPDATHAMEFIDIAALGTDGLAEFWFGRSVSEESGGTSDLWWRIEPAVTVSNREKYFATLLDLLRRFPELAARHPFAQVERGVWGMQSHTPYCAVKNLFDSGYGCEWEPSVAEQIEAVRAMLPMFAGYLARTEFERENDFFMWWDCVCGHIRDDRPGAEELRQAAFDVLCEILELSDDHCQECALHGLGHLEHPRRAERVQRFIDECDRSEWRLEWLVQCRDGTVL